eukprot:4092817-Prymnesium_polylepis.1
MLSRLMLRRTTQSTLRVTISTGMPLNDSTDTLLCGSNDSSQRNSVTGLLCDGTDALLGMRGRRVCAWMSTDNLACVTTMITGQ